MDVNSQDEEADMDEEAAAEGGSFDAGNGGEDVLEGDDWDVWGLLDDDLFIHPNQRQQQTKQEKQASRNKTWPSTIPWTRARTTL